MQIKTCDVRFKTADDDAELADGEFLVYPSTFTRTPDSYGDVVAKGAFAETIAAWKASGNVLPGLYGHRLDDPDFFVAGAIDMGEDDHGWWVKGSFDLESPKGRQVYRLVKGRRLTQLSFAFDVLDGAPVKTDDGADAYELRKVHVYEFSFVPIGANQDTSVVAVKAIADGLKAGRVISAKNLESLEAARDSIDAVIKAATAADDQEKASGTRPAKDEEPAGAKSEEPSASPSVDDLATHLRVLAASGED